MTISEILYYVTVFHSKSLSRAADELNISQQGLGKAIRNLERELGVQLLVRTPQGVTPTEIGTRVAADLSLVLEKDREIRHYTAEYRKALNHTRRFACSPSQLGGTIAKAVEEYNRTSATVVEFFFTDENDAIQEEKLRAGAYDIRMISQELNRSPDLPLAPIYSMVFSLFANSANPLCSQIRVPFCALDGKTVIIDGFSHAYARVLGQYCTRLGISPVFREIPDRFYAIQQLMAQPDCLYFAAFSTAEMVTALGRDRICRIDIDPPFSNTICLQFHGEADEALVAHIREYLHRPL